MSFILKKIVCLMFCFFMFCCNVTCDLKVIQYNSNICGINISDIANFIFKNSFHETGFENSKELQKDLRNKYSNNKVEIIICVDDDNQKIDKKRRRSIMHKNKNFNPRYTFKDFLGVVVRSEVGYNGTVIRKDLNSFIAQNVVEELTNYNH